MNDLDGYQSLGLGNLLTAQKLSSSAFTGSKSEGHREERITVSSEEEGHRKDIEKGVGLSG